MNSIEVKSDDKQSFETKSNHENEMEPKEEDDKSNGQITINLFQLQDLQKNKMKILKIDSRSRSHYIQKNY